MFIQTTGAIYTIEIYKYVNIICISIIEISTVDWTSCLLKSRGKCHKITKYDLILWHKQLPHVGPVCKSIQIVVANCETPKISSHTATSSLVFQEQYDKFMQTFISRERDAVSLAATQDLSRPRFIII